uniref:Uncharacterized protein n=1 Tax=Arundo donax TaxID=35708 RepID=A0A0A8ZM16_ARUDO
MGLVTSSLMSASPASIETTFDMGGRLWGAPWVQWRATRITSRTSSPLNSVSLGSTNSSGRSFSYSSQTLSNI